ncbi:MAG: sugar ABC transporter substrate-binding protein [Chloroflexota bacterium]
MKRFTVLAILAAMMLTVVGGVSAQDDVTIRYWLWDTNQLPPYEECAAQFMEANPTITIEIEQRGWGDYWTAITSGFVTGDAPDVFTNHLAKYPEFVELGQIIDIEPWVERDSVPTDIYYPGLAELWSRDGARYGLPKDYDTVAVVYNAEALEAAGVTVDEVNSMTWNPEDGGTFDEVLARLTIDANGNNALSEDFDADNIVQFGFANSWGDAQAYGQTEFSWLSHTTGWEYNNGNWGDEYYYDDERFIQTIDYITGLWLDKNYAAPFEAQTSLGKLALFQAGEAALVVDGSWMIGSYLGSDFEVGFARLPEGPEGRKSMFNGLADSIWVGTENPDESWEWVKFLASPQCQNIVGESAVVFPAIPAAADTSLAVRAEAGVDVSAFVDQAAEEGGTFLFPITDFGGEIATIMDEAMESIALGQAEAAEILPEVNEEVNDLF